MTAPSRTPSLDAAFLLRWSPARFMLVGIVLYAAAMITSPLVYAYEFMSWGGLLYGLVTILVYFVGCYLGHAINARSGIIVPSPFHVSLDRYINLTIAIAALSLAARVYDRFILRGFAIAETYFETRETVEGSNVSLFGYLGGPGFMFGLIALALMWLSSSQRRRPVTFVITVLLAAYPVVEALLQGSRSSILQTGYLVYFFARSTGALSWLVRSRLVMGAAVVAMLVFFQIIFEIRTLEGGGYDETISEVYRLSGMAEYAVPPAWLTNLIIETDGRGALAGILKTWTHFEQYMTHSWLVYFANFEQFQEGGWGWARMHLNLPLRLLSSVMGEDLTYNPFNYGMVEGLFSTALSSLYYDFGPLGPLVAGLFGLIATRIQALTIRLPERWLPLYALLCFTIVTTPLDNLLIGSLGAFAIWGMMLYVGLHAFISTLSQESYSTTSAQAPAE